MKKRLWIPVFYPFFIAAQEPDSSLQNPNNPLRLINFVPHFSQHVDSLFTHEFSLNRSGEPFLWYLRKAPAGLSIHKEKGVLSFRADKNMVRSGRLKLEYPYVVTLGVQHLHRPEERLDTSFSFQLYNTEINISKVMPSVVSALTAEEGETLSFTVQCGNGSFPIQEIMFQSNMHLPGACHPRRCGDTFSWPIPFDFIRENDSEKSRQVLLHFIGSDLFNNRDTATIKLTVKDGLNYPLAMETYTQAVKAVRSFQLQLKYSFVLLERKLKRNKRLRTAFDLTSAASATAGTILNSSADKSSQKTGKFLPSIGVALVPIKEASAPGKVVEQNQATLLRTTIKRLEYVLFDLSLTGERDPLITVKTQKIKEELKQCQLQIVDIPIDIVRNNSEEEINAFFNSSKINRKYHLRN